MQYIVTEANSVRRTLYRMARDAKLSNVPDEPMFHVPKGRREFQRKLNQKRMVYIRNNEYLFSLAQRAHAISREGKNKETRQLFVKKPYIPFLPPAYTPRHPDQVAEEGGIVATAEDREGMALESNKDSN